MRIEPFRTAIDEAALDDLKRRLAATREPVWPEGGGWEYGIERETLSRDACLLAGRLRLARG